MKIDPIRVQKYLADIIINGQELKLILNQGALQPNSINLKAVKYILIELAEAMSNTLQHILAKHKGIAVRGYIDTIAKSYKEGIISEEIFQKLKPFFDFRKSLVHRYWVIDDEKLIANIEAGKDDFEQFATEIQSYIKQSQQTLTAPK